MSNPIPTSLALSVINTNDPIDSAPLRNDFAAVQAGVNGLITALSNGTAGQVLTAVDATDVVYQLLVNANIDPAAAIALTKLAAGTNHALLLSGASTVGSLPTGTAGQILVSGGAGADPAWTTRAAAQVTPADPTGNSSATAKMMGLSSGTTVLTPNSTRVFVTVSGNLTIETGGSIAGTHLRYGTGNGPANAAALTGTVIGNTAGYVTDSPVNHPIPFTLHAIVTGLTPATAIWFDLDAFGDGSFHGYVSALTIDAFDLV